MMLHKKSSEVSSVTLTSSDCDGGRVAGAGICEGGLGEWEGARALVVRLSWERGGYIKRIWILLGGASQFFG
jgi:hypothetical protein